MWPLLLRACDQSINRGYILTKCIHYLEDVSSLMNSCQNNILDPCDKYEWQLWHWP